MFQQIARKVFGSANDRTLKKIAPLVEATSPNGCFPVSIS